MSLFRSATRRPTLLAATAILAGWSAGVAFAQPTHHHHHQPAADAAPAPGDAMPDSGGKTDTAKPMVADDEIAAVVDGNVITKRDVDNRGRLFAMSTGLPLSEEVLARLRPQITRQLIDERLKMREILNRKIIISTKEIAGTIDDIEKRNGMEPGSLRRRLSGLGVDFNTLVDQVRVQLGWSHVLRQELADRARISEDDIEQREAALKTEDGQPEWNIGEIFVPIEDPAHQNDAQTFAATVIKQLRAGAPFAVVAAEFSQDQSALEGGARGWVGADSLDPQVVSLLNEMPVGAISDPVRVAGGYEIVTLRGKRTVGHQMANILSLRQAFFPFTSALNPQAPTPQQRDTLVKAAALSKSAHDCGAIEAANAANGNIRPANPGEVEADRLNPAMRAVVDKLAINEASRPLVSGDGIAVLMVCARDQKNLATQSREEIADQLLGERVEMASRQLLRELHRRSVIEIRNS
jgi:peptidyl-prolyl cis-trans isomerase SurA